MCGIAGAMYWQDAEEPPAVAVSAMVGALRHRGPDGLGVSACTPEEQRGGAGAAVALGHTRLAILDLSDRGAQPMRSPCGRIWITFNGEVYNFAELRAELERNGDTFASRSDTEVILRGYERWGEDVVTRLRGMFAFAIWDGRIGSLLIARDRLGIKPVYIYHDKGSLLFASEVRALLASGQVPRRLNRAALDSYLAYQTVPPPSTLVVGVHMLAPGSILRVDADGRMQERCYWDLLDAASARTVLDEDAVAACAHVRRLLVESTALHLVSDVPVGIFLSGGIDSSALVALTREAGTVPRTFSVVLPGSTHDESRFAAEVARTFGADHEEITLSGEAFRNVLPEALASMDHPSGDGLNTFAVAQAVRRAGVKVALSGLGGDEIFGGYPSFQRMRRLAAWRPIWRSPIEVRAAAAAAVRAVGRESVGSSKAAAVLESDGTVAQAFPILRQLFDASERSRLLGEVVPTRDAYVELLERAAARHPDASVMALVSYAESRTYMHDVLLRDTDQMSMAHGLEVRVPLLDHVLAEYVVGLPDRLKNATDRPKALLVDALGGVLPRAAMNRPKQGFVLPFGPWMRGELRGLCEHHLGPNGLAGRGLFRPQALQDLWSRFLTGHRTTSWSRPWTLVALNAWLEASRLEG